MNWGFLSLNQIHGEQTIDAMAQFSERLAPAFHDCLYRIMLPHNIQNTASWLLLTSSIGRHQVSQPRSCHFTAFVFEVLVLLKMWWENCALDLWGPKIKSEWHTRLRFQKKQQMAVNLTNRVESNVTNLMPLWFPYLGRWSNLTNKGFNGLKTTSKALETWLSWTPFLRQGLYNQLKQFDCMIVLKFPARITLVSQIRSILGANMFSLADTVLRGLQLNEDVDGDSMNRP